MLFTYFSHCWENVINAQSSKMKSLFSSQFTEDLVHNQLALSQSEWQRGCCSLQWRYQKQQARKEQTCSVPYIVCRLPAQDGSSAPHLNPSIRPGISHKLQVQLPLKIIPPWPSESLGNHSDTIHKTHCESAPSDITQPSVNNLNSIFEALFFLGKTSTLSHSLSSYFVSPNYILSLERLSISYWNFNYPF